MRISVFTFLAATLLQACSAAAAALPSAYAVWAKPEPDQQRTSLHYAAKQGGKWDTPKELPAEPGRHFTPVIAADRKGAVWIVWTEQKADENILRYAVVRGGKTETGRVLRQKNSEKEQSYAPAIVIDPQDAPWIAWSGVTEGQMADIYTSSWLGGGWTEPLRAHEPNQTPDITPILGLRGGKDLWLSWFGISQEQGKYVRYSAELRGGGKWAAAGGPDPAEDVAAFIAQRSRVQPFPEQAGQWLTGAFFAGLDCEIQSLSEQFTSFKQEGGGK